MKHYFLSKEHSKKMPYGDSIQKINDDLYIAKKDDLYFSFNRINSNNINFWKSYTEHKFRSTIRLEPNIADVISSFQESFKYCYTDDLWIAFATTKDLSDSNTRIGPEKDIEMCFTVMTNKDIPFTTHMGIFRAPEFNHGVLPTHKNLSMDLHSFAAKASQIHYGNKEYMITVPLPNMRGIMASNLPKDAITVGSHNERARNIEKKDLLEKYKKDPISVDLLEFSKILGIGDSDIENCIHQINIIEEDLRSYADDLESIIEDAQWRFEKHPARLNELQLLEKRIKDQELSISKQCESLIDLLNNWKNDFYNELKKGIDKSLKLFCERSINSRFKDIFGDEAPSYQSPLEINGEKIVITKHDGSELSLKAPTFYNHCGLHCSLPTVIIDLNELANLKALDGYDPASVTETNDNYEQINQVIFSENTHSEFDLNKNYEVCSGLPHIERPVIGLADEQ